MDSSGNIREITKTAPLRNDEILIPDEKTHEELLAMTRQQRRAWYREQAKKTPRGK